jgi:hypothetical protein
VECGFEHKCAARGSDLLRHREPRGGACCLNNQCEAIRAPRHGAPGPRGLDVREARQAQLTRVLADHHDTEARRPQDACDQLCELAVAEYTCLTVCGNVDLFEDFARRGQGFCEHGSIIGDARGHAVQIHDRQRQKFGEGAIMAQDSKHASPLAMRRNSTAAISAHLLLPMMTKPQASAGKIDFANDAPPYPVLVTCAGDPHNVAHEFMAERAVKIVIAAQDFDIGIADSRQANPDQCPPGPQSRPRLLHQRKMIPACDGGEHSKGIGAQAATPGNLVWAMPDQRAELCPISRCFLGALPVPHCFPPGALTVHAVALSIDVATCYGQDY